MTDPRVQKLAKIMVHYSLELQPGDRFRLSGSIASLPLLREVYREAVRAGAEVSTRIEVEDFASIFLQEASDELLTTVPELAKYELEYFNKTLHISASENIYTLSGVDPKRITLRSRATRELGKRNMERAATGELRWCLTRFPTQGHAMAAGMALSEYEEFVYGAGKLNEEDPIAAWKKVSQEQQRIVDYLNQHDVIHIEAPGTDLTYRVKGRTWISADGKVNFPDGEVFTGPIEDSVNGVVTFSYPAIYQGNEVENVRLVFKDGKVIESSADRGLDFLNTMLDMDEGSRFVGEVAIGTNYDIQRFTKDILFDEKLGGTMHMALGQSYPDTGGKNESGLHWDMICDLRQGRITADGELFYENGKFLI
ncbi:aminopeptidase [Thermosporothrix hazakensis]|jgi:aminopeptidase|uniref:Aminopeptidase n=2 Tax=Thermosporothrix TaxID=768650 RepID=A0A326U5D4_THEHA|nr:aminopeptidase [Thermosporothrix hazakensis]PZW26654.1 aminopeptidase [Thermosporothrix hazakensis]BBH89460.1 aminopeptidase [Thermosporothrix sp. COM3]GCE47644.1 aminopeptidase [Thermosporothrix hazakensis]